MKSMENVEEFDYEGMLDRLTVLVDKLWLVDRQYSPRRRDRYRELAQAQIKSIREEWNW
ncbi:MAG: hypothetical protein AAF518_17575 [Spirochaetota bacterium]